jgi:Autographiviridae endonuclease VII
MLDISKKVKTGKILNKFCRKCGADYWYSVIWNGKKPGYRCGPCSAKWRKEWKNRNRDKYRNWSWRQRGIEITVNEYNRLFSNQHGSCAICGRTDRKLRVDHCHETGKIRGLLCAGCNALAQDLGLLKTVLAYVEGGGLNVGCQ